MSVRIKPELQRFIDDQVRDSRYDSPEAVVEAGLTILKQREEPGSFDAGEFDRLLAEGEADIESGNFDDGEGVFAEIDRLSIARKQGNAK